MTDFGERRRILPKTGQTTSYRTGDDGDLKKGWDEGGRFKDVGDGTVIDNATGLMWPKDFAGNGGNGGNTLLWNAAIDWANALEFAGHSDWRLPNLIEAISLLRVRLPKPFTHDVFDNVAQNVYWTSTTDPNTIEAKMCVRMHLLHIVSEISFMSSCYVTAVRNI